MAAVRRARAGSPSRSVSRSRSSPAARTLNVTARISRARRLPGGEQVRDAVRERAGLAGPGAGHDQQRAGAVADGERLLGRQAGEQRVGRASGGRGRGAPAAGWVMRHLPVMGSGEAVRLGARRAPSRGGLGRRRRAGRRRCARVGGRRRSVGRWRPPGACAAGVAAVTDCRERRDGRPRAEGRAAL